jgi:hypothetical protein
MEAGTKKVWRGKREEVKNKTRKEIKTKREKKWRPGLWMLSFLNERPCRFTGGYQRFGETYCPLLHELRHLIVLRNSNLKPVGVFASGKH